MRERGEDRDGRRDIKGERRGQIETGERDERRKIGVWDRKEGDEWEVGG